ncbi:hypothetical protein [Planomonospora sp. ID82291]|uniref:hypothetical protein n=1 Tax=Planomonospora sp. ID82291 TaxID=2738136 RepID=UPI0018C42D47|nr:hypothetical protein [Planomonospora sp. ID82291]MBG0816373.1 hypothetical protein [Planomonospora sp. ID82291]
MARRSARAARSIDVTRLPEDVAALVDALEPGEELVVTRGGEPIAAITGTRRVLRGAVVDPGTPREADEPPPADYDEATVVATAMKLSASARVALADRLGPDYVVLDMHAAPTTADVLLTPPVSPQLIANLRSMFPKARVIITEIDDDELGVSYHGPVRRLLDAGAEAYLPPATIPRLAGQLDHITRLRRLAADDAAPPEIEPATGPPGDDGDAR